MVVCLIGIAVLWLSLRNLGAGLNAGGKVFNAVHVATVLLLMVLTPLLTADTISREKREGTLDLLFLTSLTSMKFVATKFASQFIRILSVWAVFIPLSIIPLLSGGVLLSDVQLMLIIELTVILLGLSAGLLASVLSKRMLAALVLSLFFSGAFLWLDVLFVNSSALPGVNLNPASGVKTYGLNLLFVILVTILILHWIARLLTSTKQTQCETAAQRWFRTVFLTPT